MPTVTIEGEKSFEAEAGKKLVLALEDNGIDILHRCGGNARCTTCRVEVVSGEFPPQSEAEIEAVEEPELIAAYRLSCQLHVAGDVTLRVAKRASVEGIAAGPRPKP